MISFESDYTTGMHPKILERLAKTNLTPQPGYGEDAYTKKAKTLIKKACGLKGGQIYLATGGTQANQLVISSLLESHEGVVAAETGHIASHEAGAIEYSGHKVLTIPHHMGKIDARELKEFILLYFYDKNNEHMVYPGMVYISQPTEYGSLYSKKELEAIHNVCRDFRIPLFIDGARLIYALGSKSNDVALTDFKDLCEIFYIGGTKAGAILGEAIVFTNKVYVNRLVSKAKQRGALPAKGRLAGISFETLFTDDLYKEIGAYAYEMRDKLIRLLKEHKIEFFYESPTNQQFIILENKRMLDLRKKIRISYWEPYDRKHSVVRLAVSWSTTDKDLDALSKAL